MTHTYDAYLASWDLQLTRLDENHYLDYFECGHDEAMDRWLSETARKWQDEDLCTVWILSKNSAPETPLGFFTLSSHQIVSVNVGRKDKASGAGNREWVNALERPFPAQLLGKFALDADHQGKGLGSMLMLGVYAKHEEVAAVAGAKFLLIDVQEPALVSYYTCKFGFIQASGGSSMSQLYRSTQAIRNDLAEALA